MDGRAAVAERMLTTEQAAELLGISVAQAKRWAVAYPRQLGAVKATPRGRWRFPESKAIAALAEGLKDETREERTAA